MVTGKIWPGLRPDDGANGRFRVALRIGRRMMTVSRLVLRLLASLVSKHEDRGRDGIAGKQEVARPAAADDVERQADDADGELRSAGERRRGRHAGEIDLARELQRESEPVAGRHAAVARGEAVEEGLADADPGLAGGDARNRKIGPRRRARLGQRRRRRGDRGQQGDPEALAHRGLPDQPKYLSLR
jgi:hypothetical protein